jgi:hypothetical protein
LFLFVFVCLHFVLNEVHTGLDRPLFTRVSIVTASCKMYSF